MTDAVAAAAAGDAAAGANATPGKDDAAAAASAIGAAADAAKAAADKAAADAGKTPEQLAAEKKAADEAAAGAPEKYEAFTLPEGFKADEAGMQGFMDLAKKGNLSQAMAQEFVTFAAQREAALLTQLSSHYDTMRAEWNTAAKADKDFGGTKYDESLATAAKAIHKFNPGLFKALDETGFGDHPEMIRFAAAVGKAIGEAGLHVGGAGNAAPIPPEQRIYTHPDNLKK